MSERKELDREQLVPSLACVYTGVHVHVPVYECMCMNACAFSHMQSKQGWGLAPVVPGGVCRGLLDALEGLSVQDAVVHVDGVAVVLPLSLRIWGQGSELAGDTSEDIVTLLMWVQGEQRQSLEVWLGKRAPSQRRKGQMRFQEGSCGGEVQQVGRGLDSGSGWEQRETG